MKIFKHESGFTFNAVVEKLAEHSVNLIKAKNGAIKHPDGQCEEVWFFELGDKESPVYPMSDDEIMEATVIRSHCEKLGVSLSVFGWTIADQQVGKSAN